MATDQRPPPTLAELLEAWKTARLFIVYSLGAEPSDLACRKQDEIDTRKALRDACRAAGGSCGAFADALDRLIEAELELEKATAAACEAHKDLKDREHAEAAAFAELQSAIAETVLEHLEPERTAAEEREEPAPDNLCGDALRAMRRERDAMNRAWVASLPIDLRAASAARFAAVARVDDGANPRCPVCDSLRVLHNHKQPDAPDFAWSCRSCHHEWRPNQG